MIRDSGLGGALLESSFLELVFRRSQGLGLDGGL